MPDIAIGLVPRDTRSGSNSGGGGLVHDRVPSMATLVVAGFLFAVGLITAVAAFATFKGMSFAHFTRDPVSVMGGPAYIGFISNVGIVLWISAAATALTAALWVTPAARNFLLATGVFTLLLGLDDLFMLHEDILPRLGVPQKATVLTYAVLATLYALFHHREILRGPVMLFGLAGFFLGMSVAIDSVFPFSSAEASVEDAAKLFGIVFWFLFVASNVISLRAGAGRGSP